MTRLSTIALLQALGLAWAPIVARAQERVEPSYAFTKGEKRIYRIDEKVLASIPFPGMEEMKMTSDRRFRRLLEVLEVDGSGNATLASTTEAVKIDFTSPVGMQSYDSEQGGAPAEPGLAMHAATIGKAATLKVTRKGEVTHIDASGIAGAMREANPMLDAMGVDVEGLVGAEIRLLFPRVGSGPLARGDSFEHTTAVPFQSFGATSITFKHLLDSIEERDGSKLAVFTITGRGEHEGELAMMPGARVELARCDVSGKLVFDLGRGAIHTHAYKIDRALKVKIDQDGTAMEMEPKSTLDVRIARDP